MESTANGATWDIDNQECFAEFSASKIDEDESSSYQTCVFQGKGSWGALEISNTCAFSEKFI
jgi:hypothetical protein